MTFHLLILYTWTVTTQQVKPQSDEANFTKMSKLLLKEKMLQLNINLTQKNVINYRVKVNYLQLVQQNLPVGKNFVINGLADIASQGSSHFQSVYKIWRLL